MKLKQGLHCRQADCGESRGRTGAGFAVAAHKLPGIQIQVVSGEKPQPSAGSQRNCQRGLVSVAVAFLCTEARTTPSPLLSPSNGTCHGNNKCNKGIILPIWYPEDPSMGDKIARVIVYFVAMIYMFLGVSIIADRFMAAIEVITSQEREIVIKRPNGETTTTTIRVWNDTVSNLTLMALGSSAPEIMLSVIEVCGHGFKSGELGPATIVGSAAFNMFVIIGLCVSVIPQGEVRKVKHLRVFFVTAGWSIFAYIWLYMILAVFSPNVVQVWEGLLTLAFFPLCVILAWVADRRLLFYRFMHKKYRTDKHRGVIIETETERSKGIEMDGKLVNSHFMDGGAASNLIGLIEGKEVDESRRDMIRILKDLKQKHPEKDLDQLVEMANYYALSHQQKSRAFYRIQATRMMTGAGNILKKHVAEQAKKSVSVQEVRVEEPEEYVSRIVFEPAVYQCLENCGAVILTITRKGGDINKTISVDYKTEDGSANAGADYEFTEGTVVFKPGEMFKEISIGIIDDDIFEEDEHFFVRLGNLQVLETEDELLSPNSLPYPNAMLGFPTVATVTILDDDHSGIFTFESNLVHISESIGIMEMKVLRTSGARGTVIVPYRTMEGLAKGGGEDFEDTYGELEFKNDETWWPKTLAGILAFLPCAPATFGSAPHPSGNAPGPSSQREKKAWRRCDRAGRWAEEDYTQCPYASELTRVLHELNLITINTTNAQPLGQQLVAFTSRAAHFTDVMDVIFVTHLVERLTRLVEKRRDLGDYISDIASNMMLVEEHILWMAQNEARACTRIVQCVERIADLALTTDNQVISKVSPNIALEAFLISPSNFLGLSCTALQRPSPFAPAPLSDGHSHSDKGAHRERDAIGESLLNFKCHTVNNSTSPASRLTKVELLQTIDRRCSPVRKNGAHR
ncbi:sodium/calcium exchanger 3 isoform X1 [Solea senegalensis]|uniref:Sodium/calcium exchanger 3 isoform X1 n=1 Tax=Solea senegalensis TaxID=28829 RepID=A0AAV6RZM4_SOLSE|nr:sodium/calcium exchanger 3 isoform X1 [Solea senegalensis]